MCEKTNHIKLCTCSGINYSKGNSWQLNKSAEQRDIVGSFVDAEGLLDLKLDYLISERLLFDLNNYEVFDFYYKPSRNDLVTINLEMKTFHFLYNGIQFEEVDESDLNWKGTHLKSGKLKLQVL